MAWKTQGHREITCSPLPYCAEKRELKLMAKSKSQLKGNIQNLVSEICVGSWPSLGKGYKTSQKHSTYALKGHLWTVPGALAWSRPQCLTDPEPTTRTAQGPGPESQPSRKWVKKGLQAQDRRFGLTESSHRVPSTPSPLNTAPYLISDASVKTS